MRRTRCLDMLERRKAFLESKREPSNWDVQEIAALNFAIDLITEEREEVDADSGAVVYNLGRRWAVKRNDIGDPAAYLFMKSKRKAEQAFEVFLAEAREQFPDDPDLWPELVYTSAKWVKVS